MTTMTTELMIKEVDFNGANILVAQNIDGKMYAGVKWVCDGLGLDVKGQREKIQKHEVFSKGVATLPLPSNGGIQDTIMIELDFLPLWLANINPKLVGASVKEKLIIYQLKAKDVLAKAFLPDIESFIQNYLDMDEDERGIAYFKEKKQRKILELQNQELIPKARSFDALIGANGSQNMNSVAKSFNVGRGRLFAFLREKDILMTGSKNDKEKHNVPRQQYLEQKLFVVREYTIPDADGEIVNRTQTLVTSKGIEFIDKLLKDINYDLEKFSDLDV